MTQNISTNSLSIVSRPKNSMWVSANAGSGKTWNLVIRVARLLLSGALPEKILCLTYTTAAANEMQNRLFKELGSWSMKSDDELTKILLTLDKEFLTRSKAGLCLLNNARQLFAKALETPGGLKIQTIHSFCGTVLRKFPMEINISPNFSVLDERQKQEFVTKTIIAMLNANPNALDDIIKLFSVSDVNHFINEILIKRSLFSESFDLDAFCDCFGIFERSFNVQKELNSIFSNLPENIVDVITEAFLNGTSFELTQAKYLTGIKSMNDLEKFESLKSFFCTHSGKIRSSRSFPSKKVKLANPKFVNLFEKFKDKFLLSLSKQSQANIICKTKALYTFSKTFLSIYENYKHSERVLDYDDLIIKTRDLLINYESKWVLYKLDEGLDHILLDEAQDTSVHQWEMLAFLLDDFFYNERALSGERTFYAVGDEKQSIYSFQGADIKSFSFMKDFFSKKLSLESNKLESLELASSFRSSSAILSFVNEILSDGGGTGVENIREHIAFHKDLPGRVELWPVMTEKKQDVLEPWWQNERTFLQASGVERLAVDIASEIKKILDSDQEIFDADLKLDNYKRRVLPGDFLILVRSRGPLFKTILKKLTEYNLPVAGSDRIILLEELAIQDMISLLRFLNNKLDDLSLAEALRSPLLGFSEQDLFRLAYMREGSLFESLELNFPNHEVLQILKSLLEDTKALAPYELIERILIKYDGRLKMNARLGVSVNDVLDEFLIQAIAYEETGPPSIFGFLLWLDQSQVQAKRQLQNDNRNIRLMTIHGAKGLEAPIVILPDTFSSPKYSKKRFFLEKEGFLCAWEDGPYIPESIRILKEKKIVEESEEENRLFYVAITRAKSWLIICGVGKREAREESLKSNWYFKSQQALERLLKIKPSVEERKHEKKMLYEHNWHQKKDTKRSEEISDDFSIKKMEQSNDRLEKALSCSDGLIENKILSISVSELVERFFVSKTMKSDEITNFGPRSDEATIYGALVHSFLQLLPMYVEKNTNFVKELVFKKHKDELKDLNVLEQSFNEAQLVLKNPNTIQLLSNLNSLREVSVSGFLNLPFMGKSNKLDQIRIRGRIDLLHFAGSKVLIVDFKTNSKVPTSKNSIDLKILCQLEIYSRILQKAYPKKEISSAILWTKNAKLMKIPRKSSDEALNTIFAKQVLDDVSSGP